MTDNILFYTDDTNEIVPYYTQVDNEGDLLKMLIIQVWTVIHHLHTIPLGMVSTLLVIWLKLLRSVSIRFNPKCLLCFDSQFQVNTSRCSSQYDSVIMVMSGKYCQCLQSKVRPTVFPDQNSIRYPITCTVPKLPFGITNIRCWLYRVPLLKGYCF